MIMTRFFATLKKISAAKINFMIKLKLELRRSDHTPINQITEKSQEGIR